MSGHQLLHELFSGAPWLIVDPGDAGVIVVDRDRQFVPFTVAASASETNTMPAPDRAGVMLTLCAVSVGGGGSRAVTVTGGVNASGNTVCTFDATGEMLYLLSVPTATAGTFRWEITTNTGSVGLA